MVFPSVPVYLDPPDWYHHQQQQEINAGDPQELLQTPASHGAVAAVPAVRRADQGASSVMAAAGAATIRPTSMTERARLAKIPQPESSTSCPRCNSTNTKFCYFNNYSLSQPRHFCKSCRRYWTRGGTLRSVPVGGGCRRNKRNKSSSAAAAVSSSAKSTATNSADPSFSSTSSTVSSNSVPQLPPMASMQYSMSTKGYGANFFGIQPVEGVENYQVGTSSSNLGFDQRWRLHQIQQFPLVGGLESQPQQTIPAPPPPGMFPFDLQPKPSASGLISELASVKMEDNNKFNNPHHQYLGGARNTEQFWGISSSGGTTNADGGDSGGWQGDLSGFNTSSSRNLMQ